MEPRRKKVKKEPIPIQTILFVMISVCVCIAFMIFDKGPLLPPWPQNMASIDCHSVSFTGFNDRGGYLDFKFKTDVSVEYPPDYLPHFLSITIDTPPTTMTYSGDQITNITRTESEVGFSIIHTWAGESTISAKCLNNRPMTKKQHLKDIENYVPQYSRSDNAGIDVAKFKDVCLEYEKFLYFVQVMGDRPAVPFDNDKLRFEMLRWPLDAYLNHKKVKMTNKVCFLVAPLQKTTWKMILLTLIPLSVSVQQNAFGAADKPLFIFRKEVPRGADKVLSLLGSNPPVKLDDIMCFDTLMMTSTYSKMSDPMTLIPRALNMDLSYLRKKIPASVVSDKTIVLADNLWEVLEFRIKDKIPNAVVERLGVGSEDINHVIGIVSKAKLLIGDHISSLVNMIWMNTGGHVMDLSPGEYQCNTWAKDLADKLKLQYKGRGSQEKCKCASWDCYPMKPTPTQLDWDAVVDDIAKIINV